MEKLKLYTETEILPVMNSHTYLLFPKLGNYLKDSGDPDSERFDQFCRNAGNYFTFVEKPEDADYFLLPFNFSFETVFIEKMNPFLEKARQFSKRTMLFFNSDDDSEIDLKDVIIFRTSFNHSKQKPNTFALPGWSVDFVNYFPDRTFSVLPYDPKPTVSYCGYIDNKPGTLKDFIRSFIKKETVTQELLAKKRRGKACRGIEANKNVKTNFIIRKGFWAEGIADKKAARAEYAENMINSLYGIATRGGGNFSYRLYEILSCGRIPIFINTDSMLPFDGIIKWKEHVVWLEENDLNNIDQIVLDFHKSKSKEQLKAIQESNRKLYMDYISPDGFFKNMQLLL